VIHPIVLRAAFGRAWPWGVACVGVALLPVVLTLIFGG
jgi:hypothetical protein